MHFATKVDLSHCSESPGAGYVQSFLSHLYICLTRVIFRNQIALQNAQNLTSDNFVSKLIKCIAEVMSIWLSSWSKQKPQSVDRTSNKSGNSRRISEWDPSQVKSSSFKNIWRIALGKRILSQRRPCRMQYWRRHFWSASWNRPISSFLAGANFATTWFS